MTGKRRQTEEQDKEIQALLDAVRAETTAEFALLGSSITNPYKKKVQAFFKERKYPPAYATAFWIAYATGLPYNRNLHQKPYRP